MITATIESPSLERLRKRMAEAPRIVTEELRAGVTTATGIAAAEIRRRAPGTGGLKGAIQPALSGDRMEGRVTVLAHYREIARYQEEGTGRYGPRGRDYVIVPRVARVLRFRVGGSTVFARRVIHPGVKPHWMFRDGMIAAQPQITRVFRARLGNVTRRLGRR